MKQLLSLFVALIATTALWAQNNVITYTATSKLPEMEGYGSGFHTDVFNVSVTSHTFSNGVGTITFAGSVTRIGYYAFEGCTSLQSITIPNSVTSFKEGAFYDCSSLQSITIPDRVTSMGYGVFNGCSSLDSIIIPNSVTSMGDAVFSRCSSLKSITISNKVSRIGDHAFGECTSLQSITIPNSVTKIAQRAFAGCSGLTSITIPSSVIWIGVDAFSNCSGLTSITIPSSVTDIGVDAFSNCSGLTYINVDTANTYYASIDGVLFNYTKDTLIQCPIGNTRTAYIIPNSVTMIGYGAFRECSGLASVTIPNSVTTIKDYAFSGCSGLTSMTCYAVVPPWCTGYSWKDVDKSIPVYVPAQSVDAYERWEGFINILPIGAEEVPTTEKVIAQPSANEVTITWPQTDNADTYTIEIKKGSDLFCTLTFNAQGIMINITFAAPARDGVRTSSNAEMTDKGYRFTVTGLESSTNYTYSVIAKDAAQQTVKTYSGEFTTTGGSTSLEGLTIDDAQCTIRKFIKNNQLQIIHNGKTYNALGF